MSLRDWIKKNQSGLIGLGLVALSVPITYLLFNQQSNDFITKSRPIQTHQLKHNSRPTSQTTTYDNSTTSIDNSTTTINNFYGAQGTNQTVTNTVEKIVEIPVNVTNLVNQTVTNTLTSTNEVKLPNKERQRLLQQVQDYRTRLNQASNQLNAVNGTNDQYLKLRQEFDVQAVALSHVESLLLSTRNDYTNAVRSLEATKKRFNELENKYSNRNNIASSDEQKVVNTIVSKLAFLPGDTIHVEIDQDGRAVRNNLTYPFATKDRTLDSITALKAYTEAIKPVIYQGEVTNATSRTFDDFATNLGISQDYVKKIDPETGVSGLDRLVKFSEAYGTYISQNKPLIFNNPNGVTTVIGPRKIVDVILSDKREAIKYFNGGKK